MWAFGIGFAVLSLVACGIAVATYNEGATDFKATPAYKESIQSRELLEEPEGSNSDVFELNPTEEAPSLE
ncbi:Chaperone protein like [Actinidia chinensis var. chinensis]|uniref:Chaperone protein like n=1 Tax=Actinidia chinensis var. chinensis TaxID=1590841 RepID=A0A2R6P7Z1_ACTCC|nr:Chaperone protein like [Actinidia chinensis var. chinensis]